MRLSVQDIRRHNFSRKMRGFDPIEVGAFLELVAQEMELAQRDVTDTRVKLQVAESELDEFRKRERALQDALKHAQEASQQMIDAAKRQTDLLMREAQSDVEREKWKGQQEILRLQDEAVKLQLQKDHFLRRIRHILQAEQELLEVLATESPLIEAIPVVTTEPQSDWTLTPVDTPVEENGRKRTTGKPSARKTVEKTDE
ncbi:MAG: DivIVA domain-containing protein [bacterium]|nr:DivIVA domain-containing protein [bacterium]